MANQVKHFDVNVLGSKRVVNTIICDDLPGNLAYVSVMVHFAGSYMQKQLLSTCAHFAMHKNGARLFRSNMHGYTFNPYANKMNVISFRYIETKGTDGAPSCFTLRCRSKPHMAGKALALLTALLFHECSASDASYGYFSALTKDKDHLCWGFTELAKIAKQHAELSISVPKEKMFKDKWAEQFDGVLSKKADPPKSKGKEYSPKEKVEFPHREKKIITFDLSKAKDPRSVLYLVQIVGRPCTTFNGKVTFVISDIEETYEIRRIRNICRSEGAIERMTTVYSKFATSRDKDAKKAVATSLALVARHQSLPDAYVGMLARMTDELNAKKVHGDLEKLFD